MSVEQLKRVQGRPIRGEGDVGRDKVIEAARAILRVRPRPALSRKAVADAAGVTPALVSYYFPDKNSLVSAATRPVIGRRIDQLLAIIGSAHSRQERLRQILGFLVSLNEAESHLIDHAIALCNGDAADPVQGALLEGVFRHLRSFYVEGVAAGEWRAFDPDLCLLALWGMCKVVAQTGSVAPADLPLGPDRRDSNDRIEMIIDLAQHGLRPSVDRSDVHLA